jgi:hypothetical protein
MAADVFAADFDVRIDENRDCGTAFWSWAHQHATVRGVPFDHVLAEVYELVGRGSS